VWSPRLGLEGDELTALAWPIGGVVALWGVGWVGWFGLRRRDPQNERAAMWWCRAVVIGAVAWILWCLPRLSQDSDELVAAMTLTGLVAMYCSAWTVLWILQAAAPRWTLLHHGWRWVMIAVMVLYGQEGSRAFVYFQF